MADAFLNFENHRHIHMELYIYIQSEVWMPYDMYRMIQIKSYLSYINIHSVSGLLVHAVKYELVDVGRRSTDIREEGSSFSFQVSFRLTIFFFIHSFNRELQSYPYEPPV